MQEGDVAAATAIVDRLLAASSTDDEALLIKGNILLAQGQFAEAIEVFKDLLAVAPAEEQAYFQLGQAHARLGKTEEANNYLSKHRKLLDAKVRLYKLEQQAVLEPFNVDLRKEIVASYRDIGLDELADFWSRSAL